MKSREDLDVCAAALSLQVNWLVAKKLAHVFLLQFIKNSPIYPFISTFKLLKSQDKTQAALPVFSMNLITSANRTLAFKSSSLHIFKRALKALMLPVSHPTRASLATTLERQVVGFNYNSLSI